MSYFVIKNDKDLYLKSHGSSYTTTSAAYLAVKLDEKRADNILKCLPRTLQPFGFYKEEIEEEDAKMFSTTEESSNLSWVTNPVCVEEYLKDTLLRLSEVNAYLEYESKRLRNFDMQILDMRHYLRDEETKLNATQLCRFAKKLQELERQRKDCKMDICRLDLLITYPDKLLTGELFPMLEGLSKPYNYRVLSKREINEMLGIESKKCVVESESIVSESVGSEEVESNSESVESKSVSVSEPTSTITTDSTLTTSDSTLPTLEIPTLNSPPPTLPDSKSTAFLRRTFMRDAKITKGLR